MNLSHRLLLTFSLLLTMTGLALGAAMPQPKVEFSADSTMESQGMVMTAKIHHAANKERMEMNLGDGKRSTMIMRMDKGVSWMLMPEQQMYMEMSMAEGKKKSQDYRDCSVQQKPAGAETVNGVRTSRYKVVMSCPDETTFDGTMWVTKENIVMKLDTVAKGGDGSVGVKMELKNLKIARQDPKLFEVPAGYQKMNLGGMFDNIGNIMQKAQEDAERKAAKKKKKRDDAAAADAGRAYTAKGREYTAKGRSYTAGGRSYTAAPRGGRDYTAKGRDYTATPRERQPESSSGGFDPVNAIKGLFGW